MEQLKWLDLRFKPAQVQNLEYEHKEAKRQVNDTGNNDLQKEFLDRRAGDDGWGEFRIRHPLVLCWNMGLSENRDHLIGIMISKTIGFRGTQHFQTHPYAETWANLEHQYSTSRFLIDLLPGKPSVWGTSIDRLRPRTPPCLRREMHSEQLLQMNKDFDILRSLGLQTTLLSPLKMNFLQLQMFEDMFRNKILLVFFHHFVPLTLNPSLRVRCVRRSWTWSVTSEKRSWKMRARSRCSSRRQSVGMIGWWDGQVPGAKWRRKIARMALISSISDSNMSQWCEPIPPISHKHLSLQGCSAVCLRVFSPIQQNQYPLAGLCKALAKPSRHLWAEPPAVAGGCFSDCAASGWLFISSWNPSELPEHVAEKMKLTGELDWRLVTRIIMYLTSFQLLRLFFLQPKRRGLELVGYLWRFLQSQCPYCWTKGRWWYRRPTQSWTPVGELNAYHFGLWASLCPKCLWHDIP